MKKTALLVASLILIPALAFGSVLFILHRADTPDDESAVVTVSTEESSKTISETEEMPSKPEPDATPDRYYIYTLLEDGTYEIAANVNVTLPERLVLPAEHKGKPVTRVAENAFRGNTDIVSVVIPDSVISIGSFAFSHCAANPPDLYPELYEEFSDPKSSKKKALFR